jgi:L-iditol 2-dehydrogenase
MLAAVFHGPDDLRLEKRPTPSPGPGELLVKVGADTICGTDLRILRGEKTSGVHPGKVLGHEVAGHVVEAGRGVAGYDPGQPVAIAPVIPCGRCWECAHGVELLGDSEEVTEMSKFHVLPGGHGLRSSGRS